MSQTLRLLVPLLALSAALLSGCATEGASAGEKKAIVTADQTEVVMPVGSHIRTRVLKGQKPANAITPTAVASGEALNDALITRDNNQPVEKPAGTP